MPAVGVQLKHLRQIGTGGRTQLLLGGATLTSLGRLANLSTAEQRQEVVCFLVRLLCPKRCSRWNGRLLFPLPVRPKSPVSRRGTGSKDLQNSQLSLGRHPTTNEL